MMTEQASKDATSQPFQAEVAELLQLMVHSVYSEREIFLRELISNASDACDKLRYSAIETPSLLEDDSSLGIRLAADESAGVLKIVDTGIGMSKEELAENLRVVDLERILEGLAIGEGVHEHKHGHIIVFF